MITKYPIILVHGIMLKDFKFFRAFGRIEKMLKEKGYKVYTAKIDGIGKIETNAQQLKDYINFVLNEEKCEKVNLIAHSKGGLDSKFMIENLQMTEKIASLTTLCTPFKGSPIATKILEMPKFIVWCAKTWFNVVYKIFGDKHPDSLTVCKQLARVKNDHITTIKAPGVYVQSYSSEMKKGKDDFIMGIPFVFSKYLNKDEKSDGVVPEDSSILGNYRGNITDESLSHTQIVDFMTTKKRKEKLFAFYTMLAQDLAKKGF